MSIVQWLQIIITDYVTLICRATGNNFVDGNLPSTFTDFAKENKCNKYCRFFGLSRPAPVNFKPDLSSEPDIIQVSPPWSKLVCGSVHCENLGKCSTTPLPDSGPSTKGSSISSTKQTWSALPVSHNGRASFWPSLHSLQWLTIPSLMTPLISALLVHSYKTHSFTSAHTTYIVIMQCQYSSNFCVIV